MSEINWFVVQTKPQKERVAFENLERQGITAYCPSIEKAKRRRQRWLNVVEPLFPRYLFIQLKVGIDNFAPIRSTLGVAGMVRFGNSPAIMPESVIKIIKKQESELRDNGLEHPRWNEGELLEILDGPLKGLIGVFQKKEGNERVRLLFELLGQKNSIVLNIHNLAPAV